MPAYVLSWVNLTDPEKMAPYVAEVPEVIARYGGKYLFRGPGATALEGEWSGDRVALLEFPTHADAMRWYESPEYTRLREIRQQGGETTVLCTPDVSLEEYERQAAQVAAKIAGEDTA